VALLSRKTDYALLIMTALRDKDRGLSAREIADVYKLSRPFVANILKELCQRGYLISQRGVKGGYVLARSLASISIKELLQSLEEGFYLASCTNHHKEPGHETCSLESTCPIKAPIQELHHRLLEMLGRVTLADLSEPRYHRDFQTVLALREPAPLASLPPT
jgi:Rrf2 family transcriptional regulator, cysteine metabolism repressor